MHLVHLGLGLYDNAHCRLVCLERGEGWKALLLLRKAGHEKGNQSNLSGGGTIR